uniref:AP complex mu/sigma subunit domain-containing protein n=1 Tax=Nothoprocta perdicaria TaxID=30464 RepID=A0A8C6ZTV0_NOTPE
MRFMLLFSRQGKLRLQKWYLATADKDKKKMVRELMQVVLARKPKMCSFLEWRDLKVVYKRTTLGLHYGCWVTLEPLWGYIMGVCELDIIFNFEKAYFILDEFVMGGEIQDTSKKSVLKAIEQADLLQEVGDPSPETPPPPGTPGGVPTPRGDHLGHHGSSFQKHPWDLSTPRWPLGCPVGHRDFLQRPYGTSTPLDCPVDPQHP